MTNLHILVPAITRGTLARPHELKIAEEEGIKKMRRRRRLNKRQPKIEEGRGK